MDIPPPLPAQQQRPNRKKVRLLVAAVALVALAVWHFYPTANKHLADRNIPQLPSSAKVEHLHEGGFFAGWLYIRASLSPESFAAYAAKFTAPREIIGRAKGQILVVRHKDAEALVYRDFPKATVQFQESLPGIESWWTTHEITDGFVYRWTDGVDGWRVYFDRKRHLVFIYWHHS